MPRANQKFDARQLVPVTMLVIAVFTSFYRRKLMIIYRVGVPCGMTTKSSNFDRYQWYVLDWILLSTS
jgi:hypothetical protein